MKRKLSPQQQAVVDLARRRGSAPLRTVDVRTLLGCSRRAAYQILYRMRRRNIFFTTMHLGNAGLHHPDGFPVRDQHGHLRGYLLHHLQPEMSWDNGESDATVSQFDPRRNPAWKHYKSKDAKETS